MHIKHMCDIKKREISNKVKIELITELSSIKGVDDNDFWIGWSS